MNDGVPELPSENDRMPISIYQISSQDGYVEYDGDIIVQESILEGSQVRVTGTLTVLRNVFGSRVIGERGVSIIGNCVDSHVSSGWAAEFFAKSGEVVKQLVSDLEKLIFDIKQVLVRLHLNRPEMVGASVIGALLETHYSGTMDVLRQLLCQDDSIIPLDFGDAYNEIIQTVGHWRPNGGKSAVQLSHLEHLHRLLTQYLQYMETCIVNDMADMMARSITTSTIQCAGNLKVGDYGVHASVIESGGAIYVEGAVRGGFLTARSGITVDELGSRIGVETSARVTDPTGSISINRRHPNTLIDVGGKRDINTSLLQKVKYQVQ